MARRAASSMGSSVILETVPVPAVWAEAEPRETTITDKWGKPSIRKDLVVKLPNGQYIGYVVQESSPSAAMGFNGLTILPILAKINLEKKAIYGFLPG